MIGLGLALVVAGVLAGLAVLVWALLADDEHLVDVDDLQSRADLDAYDRLNGAPW